MPRGQHRALLAGSSRKICQGERARVLAWKLHSSSRKFSLCLSQIGLYNSAPFVLFRLRKQLRIAVLMRGLQTASRFPEDTVIWD